MANKKTRILFHPGATGLVPTTNIFSSAQPLIYSPDENFEWLVDYADVLTNNHGNLVHYEAITKIIDYQAAVSCRANLLREYKKYSGRESKFFELLRKNFDYIVVSAINFITDSKADNDSFAVLEHVLKNAGLPFSVFGVGIQNIPDAKKFRSRFPRMYSLLHFYDQNAEIFSCRGMKTVEFLKNIGCANQKAHGCPSLFAYPDNMLRIETRVSSLGDQINEIKIAAAGKIHSYRRAKALFSILNEPNHVEYFFQDELRPFSEVSFNWEDLFIDRASGEIGADRLYHLFQAANKKLKIPKNFRYFLIHSVGSWRQQVSNNHVYVGDRLHGGIVAMQASLPAVFLGSDARVEEAVGVLDLPYFPIPNGSEDLNLTKCIDQIKTHYTGFSARYQSALGQMSDSFASSAISVSQRISNNIA